MDNVNEQVGMSLLELSMTSSEENDDSLVRQQFQYHAAMQFALLKKKIAYSRLLPQTPEAASLRKDSDADVTSSSDQSSESSSDAESDAPAVADAVAAEVTSPTLAAHLLDVYDPDAPLVSVNEDFARSYRDDTQTNPQSPQSTSESPEHESVAPAPLFDDFELPAQELQPMPEHFQEPFSSTEEASVTSHTAERTFDINTTTSYQHEVATSSGSDDKRPEVKFSAALLLDDDNFPSISDNEFRSVLAKDSPAPARKLDDDVISASSSSDEQEATPEKRQESDLWEKVEATKDSVTSHEAVHDDALDSILVSLNTDAPKHETASKLKESGAKMMYGSDTSSSSNSDSDDSLEEETATKEKKKIPEVNREKTVANSGSYDVAAEQRRLIPAKNLLHDDQDSDIEEMEVNYGFVTSQPSVKQDGDRKSASSSTSIDDVGEELIRADGVSVTETEPQVKNVDDDVIAISSLKLDPIDLSDFSERLAASIVDDSHEEVVAKLTPRSDDDVTDATQTEAVQTSDASVQKSRAMTSQNSDATQTDHVQTTSVAIGCETEAQDAMTSAYLQAEQSATHSQSESSDDDDAIKRSYNEILATKTFVKAKPASDSSVS